MLTISSSSFGREQKTPNPLPSGFGIGLPGLSAAFGASSREQKTANPLLSGFGGRMNGGASGEVSLDLAVFSDTWRGGCVKAARDGGGPERGAAPDH